MNAPIHAVVPIKETSDAKRRLADVLCAARRQQLVKPRAKGTPARWRRRHESSRRKPC